MTTEQTSIDSDKNPAGSVSAGKGDGIKGPGTTEGLVARRVGGWKWFLVVCSILSAVFLFSLDNTLMADIQPKVVTHFGRPDLTPWCSLAYVLCGTAFILPWTRLYSVFSAKDLFIVSVILFEGGSALCGGAPSMNGFICGRAIAGIGGTGIYVGVVTLLSVTTTDQERSVYLSLIGIGWAIGTILGPIVGGAFADSSATWRWGFYINLVLGVVLAPVYIFWLPHYDPQPHSTRISKFKNIDFLGGVLSIGALLSGIMGISFGGVLFPWGDRRIIAMLVLSVVLFLIFGITQYMCLWTAPENRMFPVEYLRSRSMVLLGLLVGCGSTALFVPVFYLPLLFQFVNNESATRAAVRLLPFVIVLVVFVFVNGGVMSKHGLYAPWYIVGSVFVTIGGSLMFTVRADTSQSAVYGYTVLLGIGIGCYYLAGFSIAQVKRGPSQIVVVTGYMTLAQWCGVAAGISLSGAIFLNLAERRMAAAFSGLTSSEISDSLTGTDSSALSSLSDSDKARAIGIIVDALQEVYVLVIIAGALGLVLSCFLKFEKLFISTNAPAIDSDKP